MKSVSIIIAFLFISLIPAQTFAADPPPAFNAVAVAQLAQKDLEDRNLQTEIFIAGIEYKGLFGKPYWAVYWSKRFPSNTEGMKEWGLKVQLDGSYVRMVRKK